MLQTTLNPVSAEVPQTTEDPHTTELPLTFVPQTTEVPQATELPQVTELAGICALPLESVTVLLLELYVAFGDSAAPSLVDARVEVLLKASEKSTYPAPTVNKS